MSSSRNLKPAIHSRFYLWVAETAGGLTVLDAGCGDGLGAEILARTAARVVAIDHAQTAITEASRDRALPNIDYRVMDCQNLDFDDHTFDLVTSNAVFEYLENVDGFVAEATRVLKPGGRFTCGTKNLLRSLQGRDGKPLYRNHLQEFDPPQLKTLLGSHLESVKLYGETMSERAERYIYDRKSLRVERLLVALDLKHALPVSLRKRIKRRITDIDVPDIGIEDFDVVEDHIEDAHYLVGTGVKADR